MVIQTSSVAMESKYSFHARRLESVCYTGWGDTVKSDGSSAVLTPSATDSKSMTGKVSTGGADAESALLALKNNAVEILPEEQSEAYPANESVQEGSLKNLLMLFSDNPKIPVMRMTPLQLFHKMMQLYNDRLQTLAGSLGLDVEQYSPGPTEKFSENMRIEHYYEEKEESSFYSSGTVVTGDGRTIDFDIEAVMSREFKKYSSVEINFESARMMDPLVLSLDGTDVGVSDQKFLFDIDCDGKEDNISLLAKGCGFLALDKNGDGKINDGSELFGAKSGDGFGELSVYDMDGNGWIDENDEIFNRLRIWTKDENGDDKLVGLGVAGIGAIYLGNMDTDFSVNQSETNETNAMVKKSGIFLKENGGAGMIRQMDFAVRE